MEVAAIDGLARGGLKKARIAAHGLRCMLISTEN
jgi:hypothetical protein